MKKSIKVQREKRPFAGQVLNIPTESDQELTAQVAPYKIYGAFRSPVQTGHNVVLVTSQDIGDPETDGQLSVCLSAAQARHLASVLIRMADAIEVEEARKKGTKIPF